MTDPPYGIGFMGKGWDSTMIERDPEFWKLVYEILLPGGYCFAFSGSRTGHWQACAMEMAGFIMHPMHGWVFGSGFPKAHNASRAIDAQLTFGKSNPRAAKEMNKLRPGEMRTTASLPNNGIMSGERRGGETNDNPLTPEAAEWEGWAYGTQAQKPALEPIYLAQKPFDCKTGAANLLKHGVGAVNIDGCRVAADGETIERGELDAAFTDAHEGYQRPSRSMMTHKPKERSGPANATGRHPANLILDGSPEVVAMFPDSKSGAMKASTARAAQDEPGSVCYGTYGGQVASQDIAASSGSAARFFHQFGPDTDPLIYHPKAGKTDRAGSKHPTVKPIALMQYLIRHITPPGGVVLDPFAGSGTTAEAARREGFDCILMEADQGHVEFLNARFPDDKPKRDIFA